MPDSEQQDRRSSSEASEGAAEPIDMLAPLFREQTLRPEGGEAPPMWLWITIFGVSLFGAYYLGTYAGDFSPHPWLQQPERVQAEAAMAAAAVSVDGAQIYSSRCASCHQADGQGVSGAFPPLDAAEWVTGEKGEIIRILLHGMQGEVVVKGETYNGVMPAWGRQLSDEEIAAVITHIRQNWSNEATEVTTSEVGRVRDETTDRATPWSAEELRAAPRLESTPAETPSAETPSAETPSAETPSAERAP